MSQLRSFRVDSEDSLTPEGAQWLSDVFRVHKGKPKKESKTLRLDEA